MLKSSTMILPILTAADMKSLHGSALRFPPGLSITGGDLLNFIPPAIRIQPDSVKTAGLQAGFQKFSSIVIYSNSLTEQGAIILQKTVSRSR
jgi:hypothetical protein